MCAAVFAGCAVIVMLHAVRQRHWLKKLLCNSGLGVAVLVLCCSFGEYVYIDCSLNVFSLSFSTVFGIPGAIFAALVGLVQKL